jgi:NAD(P)H-dependent FMN reductase
MSTAKRHFAITGSAPTGIAPVASSRAADVVIIAAPEYYGSVPGILEKCH